MIESIAASAKYEGLRITPQLGLVPLGTDPESGLYEFSHLGSGTLPTRDPKTKRLVHAEDSAIVLVLVPGGTFDMGAQKEDPEGQNFDPGVGGFTESPVHEVTLSPFFLAKHECTQAQWKAMTGGLDPSRYKAGATMSDRLLTGRNPVEQVSWEESELWLDRNKLWLPTEAQWEYACRAGTSTPWFTGRAVAALSTAANVADAWLAEHGGERFTATLEVADGHGTHAPVGSYAANAFGLHDLHGNVLEWCHDAYLRWAYAPGRPIDPVVLLGERTRVGRGGSWALPAIHARSACRHKVDPGYRNSDHGVRASRPVTSD